MCSPSSRSRSEADQIDIPLSPAFASSAIEGPRHLMGAYEDAVDTLYAAPIDRFVAERTRLVAALRAAGDKDAAARLAKRGRPTTSAWVVNQLYRHSRADFDSMLATAAQLRAG